MLESYGNSFPSLITSGKLECVEHVLTSGSYFLVEIYNSIKNLVFHPIDNNNNNNNNNNDNNNNSNSNFPKRNNIFHLTKQEFSELM